MGNATRRTRVQAEVAQITGPKAERQQGRRAETPDDRRERLQRIRGKEPPPRVEVLKPDAVFPAGVPLFFGGDWEPGQWSSFFLSGRQCGRTAALSKPPVDDQRGQR